ncbi:hypothetical protein [Vibrio ulleungensis]|uniref:SRPBCC family protein n=1 Tax=Vibrio ulleungensis TaxID=2807619 RepID=A0ABS2HLY2_9VIBR|nr:hypothetical protein [Vibrio ulleungensis]MBM7036882.1 hypothetical protein [Vibrio ulleungensis]
MLILHKVSDIVTQSKTYSFEINHLYNGIDAERFWTFLLDLDWYTQSDIMKGEMLLVEKGQKHPQGLGAIRRLTIDTIELTEKIVGFRPHEYFSYQVQPGGKGMPVHNYTGEFYLIPHKDGMMFRYVGSYQQKYFGTGALLKWLFRSRIKTMLPIWEKGYHTYYQ